MIVDRLLGFLAALVAASFNANDDLLLSSRHPCVIHTESAIYRLIDKDFGHIN
jgi:hypothetical protein